MSMRITHDYECDDCGESWSRTYHYPNINLEERCPQCGKRDILAEGYEYDYPERAA